MRAGAVDADPAIESNRGLFVLLRHGLISADSHANLKPDDFVTRMSSTRWGDRIPQVREVEQDGRSVERWVVDGRVMSTRCVANCAAVMGDPLRRTYPQRWEEVPRIAYEPLERLSAINADGVDGEVLFFNDPLDSLALPFLKDADFELACVQAYNDALAEWRAAADQYITLALVPYLGGGAAAAQEVRRAAELGHRGIIMVAQPSMADDRLPNVNDRSWDPLWEALQELHMPVNWHAHAGIRLLPPKWQSHQALRRTAAFVVQPQFVSNFLLSGIADRFPRLTLVCAETGTGWLSYVFQACDRVWEQSGSGRDDGRSKPSDIARRQIRTTFWYETAGIKARSLLGTENIMWASDYPHGTSTYPRSVQSVDAVLEGVDDADRRRLLCENVLATYGVEYEDQRESERAATLIRS
jgi:predicted TIM-barrel fold metal-dependent hydrolase